MKYILFLLLTTALLSCEKAEIKYNDITETVELDPNELTLEGTWRLIGGKMYITNLDNNNKTRYDHFSSTKKYSSMRWGGSKYRIEELFVDSTLWTFRKYSQSQYGKFYLNGDSINNYEFQTTSYGNRINESMNTDVPVKMGASSKPFRAYLDDPTLKTIDIKVHEAYMNDNGNNFVYYNILKFEKIGD